MPHDSNMYVGIDIGTTKVCAVVVRKNEDGYLDVLGKGESLNAGMRKGTIVNIEATVKAIQAAMHDASLMSGVEIERACVSVGGPQIKSVNKKGVIAVRDGEITEKDIERVIESASAISNPAGEEVLHVLPQQYILDGLSEFNNPIGMSCVRLEAEVHIITGPSSYASNLVKSCEKAGVHVDGVYLSQLASAEAVLSEDERELGVAIIDGGAGTTDLIVIRKGAVCHTAVLPLGGHNFTRDLAVGLSAPEQDAERLKTQYGCAWAQLCSEDEVIEVPSVGGRPARKVSRPVMAQILQARAEEILNMLASELHTHGLLEELGAGVVLTGGFANLAGIDQLASQIFQCPVRIGYPEKVGGLNDTVNDPKYTVAVGLAMMHSRKEISGNKAKAQDKKSSKQKEVKQKEVKQKEQKTGPGIVDKVKDWFGEFF